MSAEGLKKAVLEKARLEAASIVDQARSAAAQAVQQAGEQASRTAAEVLEQARRLAAQEREQTLAALEREQRLQTLAAKNELLEQAFTRAAEAFKGLAAQRLRDLYSRELTEIDLQGAGLRVALGAKADFEALLGGRARVEEDPSLPAGYIVERSDFRLDRSLAARLEEIRSELRPRVAELLFGEEG